MLGTGHLLRFAHCSHPLALCVLDTPVEKLNPLSSPAPTFPPPPPRPAATSRRHEPISLEHLKRSGVKFPFGVMVATSVMKHQT